jgi:hypothetical protein
MPGLIEIDPTTLDKPIVNIQVTDPSAGEDGNAGQLLIQRIGPMAADLTINYSLAGDATNGTDYAELTGTATIPAGKSLLTIPIIALPDNEVEGDETLVVNLESGDYRLGTHGSGHVGFERPTSINRISNEVIGRDVALLDYWNQRCKTAKLWSNFVRRLLRQPMTAWATTKPKPRLTRFTEMFWVAMPMPQKLPNSDRAWKLVLLCPKFVQSL